MFFSERTLNEYKTYFYKSVKEHYRVMFFFYEKGLLI